MEEQAVGQRKSMQLQSDEQISFGVVPAAILPDDDTVDTVDTSPTTGRGNQLTPRS